MVKVGFFENRRFLLRFITSYSILLVIILFMGLYMYHISITDLKSNLHKQSLSTLTHSIDLMDETFQIMETFGSQTTSNSSISKLLHASSASSHNFYVTAASAQNFLRYFLLSEQMLPISDYFIYLPQTDYLLNSTIFCNSKQYYRYDKLYEPSYFENWLAMLNNKSNYGTFISTEEYSGKHGISLYYYILPATTFSYRQNYSGAVCFEIKPDQLENFFINLPLYQKGFIYVTDSSGKKAFTITEEDSKITDDFLKGFSNHNDMSQYDLLTLEGESMLVTASVSEYNGWHYYLVQPSDMILSGLIAYQTTYLCIIAGTCMISFALIFFLSKRHAAPIVQMHSLLEDTLKEHSSLQDTLEAQRPIICQSYAERIMNGRIHNQSEMIYITDYLNICTLNRKFCVLYVSTFINQTPDEEIKEDSHYQELVKQYVHHYFPDCILSYDVSPHEYTFLLSSQEENTIQTYIQMVTEQFLMMQQDLMESYSILIAGGMGNRNNDLMYTWKSYQQAKEAYDNTDKNIYFQAYQNISKTNTAYYYPLDFAQKLSGFITSGSQKQVEELMRLIYHENYEERSLSVSMLKWFISDLRCTMFKIRFTVTPSKEREDNLVHIDELLAKDSSFHAMSEATQLLTSMFEQKQGGNKLIVAIQQYIRENFSDASLCLNKISETFHISESYFSYLFKAETQENFSEYLERIRMDQALYLLQSTDTGINNLCLEVGYNNANSFRRAFKKVHGISPKEARKK